MIIDIVVPIINITVAIAIAYIHIYLKSINEIKNLSYSIIMDFYLTHEQEAYDVYKKHECGICTIFNQRFYMFFTFKNNISKQDHMAFWYDVAKRPLYEWLKITTTRRKLEEKYNKLLLNRYTFKVENYTDDDKFNPQFQIFTDTHFRNKG